MNIFEEAAANRQHLTITQENLPEFKKWLNNSNEPTGYSNFSIAEDLPFADIIPDNHNDEKKIEAASYLIFRAIHNDQNRINECFDLASIAPQVPATVYYYAGNGSGNMIFYEKLGKIFENRKMSDNLSLVAHNIHDIYEYVLPGQPEDIRTLSPEKRKDLANILDVYTRYTQRQNVTGPGTYNKIRFAERIFNRGDLLNYNGLSSEQRKIAVKQYISSLPNKPRYVGEDDTRISETLARLDEKYWTIDLLKEIMMETKKEFNVELKTLGVYKYIEFELNKQDKRNNISATFRPKSSGEYAKKIPLKPKHKQKKMLIFFLKITKKSATF